MGSTQESSFLACSYQATTTVTNTLAYYLTELITTLKWFIVQAHSVFLIVRNRNRELVPRVFFVQNFIKFLESKLFLFRAIVIVHLCWLFWSVMGSLSIIILSFKLVWNPYWLKNLKGLLRGMWVRFTLNYLGLEVTLA